MFEYSEHKRTNKVKNQSHAHALPSVRSPHENNMRWGFWLRRRTIYQPSSFVFRQTRTLFEGMAASWLKMYSRLLRQTVVFCAILCSTFAAYCIGQICYISGAKHRIAYLKKTKITSISPETQTHYDSFPLWTFMSLALLPLRLNTIKAAGLALNKHMYTLFSIIPACICNRHRARIKNTHRATAPGNMQNIRVRFAR